jgi:hypothetical protein
MMHITQTIIHNAIVACSLQNVNAFLHFVYMTCQSQNVICVNTESVSAVSLPFECSDVSTVCPPHFCSELTEMVVLTVHREEVGGEGENVLFCGCLEVNCGTLQLQ